VDFPYSAAEQRRQAILRAGKISIQGVQPKLSARLSIVDEIFEIVDKGGRYILKPQHADYPELPENEDLSMKLAGLVGISTPLHGLIYSSDDSLTYFIKRFDRAGQKDKLAVQDFATLAGKDRETKYDSSIERLFPILDHCTFPLVEAVELYRRLLFNYLIGNEDMHLKNWSLITERGKTELSPAYDCLSTTVAFRALGRPANEIEETALPLSGKKKGLTKKLWIDYLARERLHLNDKVINGILNDFSIAIHEWEKLIEQSFLTQELQGLYREVIQSRVSTLDI
jgi:serine/threonine-protein kinase HipA